MLYVLTSVDVIDFWAPREPSYRYRIELDCYLEKSLFSFPLIEVLPYMRNMVSDGIEVGDSKSRAVFDTFINAVRSFGFFAKNSDADDHDFYVRELKFAGSSKNKVLRYLRTFHDLSQVELADRLGMSKSYLSELESGKKDVSGNVLENYSEFFKIPMSHLYLLIESVGNEDELPIMVKRAISFLDWVSGEESIEPETPNDKKLSSSKLYNGDKYAT